MSALLCKKVVFHKTKIIVVFFVVAFCHYKSRDSFFFLLKTIATDITTKECTQTHERERKGEKTAN